MDLLLIESINFPVRIMLGILIGFCFDKFLINMDASLTQSRKLQNLVTFSVLYLVLLLKAAS